MDVTTDFKPAQQALEVGNPATKLNLVVPKDELLGYLSQLCGQRALFVHEGQNEDAKLVGYTFRVFDCQTVQWVDCDNPRCGENKGFARLLSRGGHSVETISDVVDIVPWDLPLDVLEGILRLDYKKLTHFRFHGSNGPNEEWIDCVDYHPTLAIRDALSKLGNINPHGYTLSRAKPFTRGLVSHKDVHHLG